MLNKCKHCGYEGNISEATGLCINCYEKMSGVRNRINNEDVVRAPSAPIDQIIFLQDILIRYVNDKYGWNLISQNAHNALINFIYEMNNCNRKENSK